MEYLFKWTQDLSVNQIDIDLQHKRLFNQINVLLSSIVNYLDPKIVDDAIAFLGDYIDSHLKFEEQYMQDNGYPDLEAHKISHQDFIDNYHQVKEKRESGAPVQVLATDIEQYLGNWLTNHIAHVDKKYAQYIKEKNS